MKKKKTFCIYLLDIPSFEKFFAKNIRLF